MVDINDNSDDIQVEDVDKKRSEKDWAKLVDMESVEVNKRNMESVEINKRNVESVEINKRKVRLVDEVFSADEEVQVHSKTVKIFHVTFLCLYLHVEVF